MKLKDIAKELQDRLGLENWSYRKSVFGSGGAGGFTLIQPTDFGSRSIEFLIRKAGGTTYQIGDLPLRGKIHFKMIDEHFTEIIEYPEDKSNGLPLRKRSRSLMEIKESNEDLYRKFNSEKRPGTKLENSSDLPRCIPFYDYLLETDIRPFFEEINSLEDAYSRVEQLSKRERSELVPRYPDGFRMIIRALIKSPDFTEYSDDLIKTYLRLEREHEELKKRNIVRNLGNRRKVYQKLYNHLLHVYSDTSVEPLHFSRFFDFRDSPN